MNWDIIEYKVTIEAHFLKEFSIKERTQIFLPFRTKIDTYPDCNSFWDVRVEIREDITPYNEITTRIAFLSPNFAKNYLQIGSKITFFDIEQVGFGVVKKIDFL